jgi:hypothetical protein
LEIIICGTELSHDNTYMYIFSYKYIYIYMKDRQVKQVLSGHWYQREGEGDKEIMKDSKYGGSSMYLCMKMKQ